MANASSSILEFRWGASETARLERKKQERLCAGFPELALRSLSQSAKLSWMIKRLDYSWYRSRGR